MFSLTETPGRNCFINQKEYLFFSGYSYLGMQHVVQFQNLILEGTKKMGHIFPSSRISNTVHEIYLQTETYLSRFTDTESCVLFPSGFIAGKAALEIIDQEAIIFQSPNCHPAIRKLPLETKSFSNWAMDTVNRINQTIFSTPPIILADAVNPLTAEVYDFSFLNEINQKVVCIIDDSHGIGLIGNSGSGISNSIPRNNYLELILSFSLAKACSIQAGGLAFTNPETANKIKKTNWYTAVTPPSPAQLYTFIHAIDLYESQRILLKKNIKKLIENLPLNYPIIYNKDLPFFILPEKLDEAYFDKTEIIISSFAYPDPNGKKLNRVVLSALHKEVDLNKLISAL